MPIVFAMRRSSVGIRVWTTKNLSPIVAGFASGVGLLLTPLDATACSCIPADPWRAYAAADAALVGVFEGKRGPTTYVFRVEQDFKADLGAELEVDARENGAACGLKLQPGRRYGLLLKRMNGRWASSLCSQTTPAGIRRAAAGLPAPDGRGAVRFLVGGNFGPARVQALDVRGRTLAFGLGDGRTIALAVCPGARTMVEVTADGVLAVRELRTLRPLGEVRLALREYEFPATVACGDRAGRMSFVITWRASTMRIIRVRGRMQSSLFRGHGFDGAFGRGVAYIAAHRRGVTRVALASGRRRIVSRLGADLVVPSPDGRRLAVLTDRGRFAIVQLSPRRARLGPRVVAPTRSVWIDSRRVAWVEDNGRVQVLDTAFQHVGSLRGWGAFPTTVTADGRLVGLSGSALKIARLPRGPVSGLRDLFSPLTYAVAAVDGGPSVALTATLPCVRG
jgi:hypothetical protein